MELLPLRHRVARRVMGLVFGSSTPAAAPTGPLPDKGVFRVLVCRITHTLGNTLLLTPLIREIEATWPGAEIDILTRNPAALEIFGQRPQVQTIFLVPARAFSHPLKFIGTLRRMRRSHYDVVIDPCPRSQSGRWMLLLARGRFTVGFTGSKKKGAVTHGVPMLSEPRHVAQLPVALLRAALGCADRRDYPSLEIRLSDVDRKQGREILAGLTAANGVENRKPIIGIFANATGVKLLGKEWWQRFLAVLEIHRPDCTFVEIVPMTGRSLLDSRYPAYYSSSIGKLAGVLSGLSMLISADCGVMHLACASGAPTMGIFTVTDPVEWGPYGPGNRIIDARNLTPEQAAMEIVA